MNAEQELAAGYGAPNGEKAAQGVKNEIDLQEGTPVAKDEKHGAKAQGKARADTHEEQPARKTRARKK